MELCSGYRDGHLDLPIGLYVDGDREVLVSEDVA
jgi:hypothetical protein